MNPRALLLLGLLVAACDSAGTPAGAPATAPAAAPAPGGDAPRVAARVGSKEILLADVDARISSELARIEMSRYEARRNQVEEIVDSLLLEAEAERRGVSPAELLRAEVEAKIEEPTDEQVQSFFEQIQARGQQGTLEELTPRIREALYRNAESERRNAFLEELRKDADVRIALEPPRLELDLSEGFARGPEDAPVTLVEFSDYQCPYCARSQQTVQQIRERYGDRLRHVFMDFPLEQLHPQAPAAAVAARCAGKQGKFWEYHELLFEKQSDISDTANFARWASDLGLDGEAFASCLGDDAVRAAVDRSLQAGTEVGVSGTPGFFVNGIPVAGAQPAPVFVALIDEELARKTD